MCVYLRRCAFFCSACSRRSLSSSCVVVVVRRPSSVFGQCGLMAFDVHSFFCLCICCCVADLNRLFGYSEELCLHFDGRKNHRIRIRLVCTKKTAKAMALWLFNYAVNFLFDHTRKRRASRPIRRETDDAFVLLRGMCEFYDTNLHSPCAAHVA